MPNRPTIYYFCHDNPSPTGGNKQIYRHVDILNNNGYSAYVVHNSPGYRMTWFENQTPVTYWEELWSGKIDRQNDHLVIPEDFPILEQALPVRTVIFNQNVFLGFAMHQFKNDLTYNYDSHNIVSVMTVSQNNKDILQFIYPKLNIQRVVNGIDPGLFEHVDLERKNAKIAIVGNKNPLDACFVTQVLQQRAQQGLNQLGRYRFEIIAGKTEQEVKNILA
ncbi:MAG: hypothetical protein WC838_01260, partial [Candidatus Margulisiibacteriota bacterium]